VHLTSPSSVSCCRNSPWMSSATGAPSTPMNAAVCRRLCPSPSCHPSGKSPVPPPCPVASQGISDAPCVDLVGWEVTDELHHSRHRAAAVHVDCAITSHCAPTAWTGQPAASSAGPDRQAKAKRPMHCPPFSIFFSELNFQKIIQGSNIPRK
jgi:hypothetical protein